MLVLSRSAGESITFPELEMAIEVLKVTGNRVQLGVKASAQIRVLRTELMNRASNTFADCADAELSHLLRNQLNTIGLAMTVSQKHLDRGDLVGAQLALKRAAEMLNKPNSIRISEPAEENKRKGLNVLLVEDNSNESQLLSDVLRMNGIQVRVAQNGLEAIELLAQQVPDVVLIDMHMPICDGPTTIEKIRNDQRFRKLTIYAVSGMTAIESKVSLLADRGVDNWFQKPIQSQMLLDALNELPVNSLAC